MPATYVIAYESTHAAMASEATFKREQSATGIYTTMLPTPRAISAGCGMALRFSAEDDGAAERFASLPHEAHGLANLYRQLDADAYELVAHL